MKGLILFCLVVLSFQSATVHAANEVRPGQFDPNQNDKDAEARRRELERRERALNASARHTVTAVGMDDYDCMRNLNDKANMESESTLRDCNSQTDGIVSCHIAERNTTQYPTYVSSVFGSGHYDERKTDEATCRSSSVYQAESDAVSSCQSKYGVSCIITSRGTVDSHNTYTRRRFYIMGPKEEYHECKASALASPDSRYTRQCSMEVVARAR